VRILVTGATGFIGSAVVARLSAAGHSIVAVSRGARAMRGRPGVALAIGLDMSAALTPEVWTPHLTGVDAVVNCVGLLQDAPGESLEDVHQRGPAALFDACERAGVRRVIHISGLGVDRAQPTDFSRTKFAGDAELMKRDLDWVVLRPSVVFGRTAYGGSALVRGLAALPWLPVMPNAGDLQAVQLDDLVGTVEFFLQPDAPSRLALDVAGPERLSFTDVVLAYRRWLGWRPPRVFQTPSWLAALAYRAGDLAGALGWRTPISSTAQREIARGAFADNSEWRRVTGIEPQSLSAALTAQPAGVQERWFAKLYFLKPFSLVVFAVFWIATGILSLTAGWEIGKGLMLLGGVSDPWASLVVIAGALADIFIGLAILWRRTARAGLWGGVVISLAYAVIGTILLPDLWREPLGPFLKIWPILAFNFILLAILEDR
jgi:uncharacterized protein YbjT (DUF2867 family)